MEFCPICSLGCKTKNSLSYHMSVRHNINLKNWETENSVVKCKICDKKIHPRYEYCSDECKRSDPDFNYRRTRPKKLDDDLVWKCKLCDYYSNTTGGGNLSFHLKDKHEIIVTLSKNDKKLIEEYYDVVKDPKLEKKYYYKCLLCEKEFFHDNLYSFRTGVGTHLGQMHDMTREEYIMRYDRENEKLLIYDGRISDIEYKEKNGVVCPICGEKYKWLNSKHLVNKHNISVEDFLLKYPKIEVTCNSTHHKLSEAVSKLNEEGKTFKGKNTRPEIEFENILKKLCVEYKKQYIDGIERKNRWDFYLIKQDIIIEIDGIFHLPDEKLSAITLINDDVKNKEAIKLNKKLIRVKYSAIKDIVEFKDIEDKAYYIQSSTGDIIKDYDKESYKDILYGLDSIIINKERLIRLRCNLTNKNNPMRFIIKNIIPDIFNFIRTFHKEFPVKKIKLNIEQIKEILYYLEQYNKQKNVIDNYINNFNHKKDNILKNHFLYINECKVSDNKSLKELWDSDNDLIDSIKYRCGINNSKLYEYKISRDIIVKTTETFDITIDNILGGLKAKQKNISFFPLMLSATIYDLYLNVLFSVVDPVVYDSSCGFGSRYLASKIIPGSFYMGVDCDERSIECHNEIKQELNDDDSLFVCERSEEYVPDRDVSFAFTCPPYWNRENYSYDIEQYYGTYENWLYEYVKKTAENVYRVLNLNPKICVVVVSKEQRNDYISIYGEVGFQFLEDKTYEIRKLRSHLNRSGDDKYSYSEVCLCFQKS